MSGPAGKPQPQFPLPLPPFSMARALLVAAFWALLMVALLALANWLRPEYQPELWQPRFIALVASFGAIGAVLGTLAKRIAVGVTYWVYRICRSRRR